MGEAMDDAGKRNTQTRSTHIKPAMQSSASSTGRWEPQTQADSPQACEMVPTADPIMLLVRLPTAGGGDSDEAPPGLPGAPAAPPLLLPLTSSDAPN
jgi:hypothetical protein